MFTISDWKGEDTVPWRHAQNGTEHTRAIESFWQILHGLWNHHGGIQRNVNVFQFQRWNKGGNKKKTLFFFVACISSNQTWLVQIFDQKFIVWWKKFFENGKSYRRNVDKDTFGEWKKSWSFTSMVNPFTLSFFIWCKESNYSHFIRSSHICETCAGEETGRGAWGSRSWNGWGTGWNWKHRERRTENGRNIPVQHSWNRFGSASIRSWNSRNRKWSNKTNDYFHRIKTINWLYVMCLQCKKIVTDGRTRQYDCFIASIECIKSE